MSKSPSLRRIQADIRELALDPSDRYVAHPLENDMFEWHFTIRGADKTDFENGIYHGRILLPPEYPLKPPHIMFLTPSGRFETSTKVCLSFSAYHPELWQPAWGIRLILEALISFLPTPADGAIGALDWSSKERKRLAKLSQSFKCPICCRPGNTNNFTGKPIMCCADLLPPLKPKSDNESKDDDEGEGDDKSSKSSKSNKSRFAKEIAKLQQLQLQNEGPHVKKDDNKKDSDDDGNDNKGNKSSSSAAAAVSPTPTATTTTPVKKKKSDDDTQAPSTPSDILEEEINLASNVDDGLELVSNRDLLGGASAGGAASGAETNQKSEEEVKMDASSSTTNPKPVVEEKSSNTTGSAAPTTGTVAATTTTTAATTTTGATTNRQVNNNNNINAVDDDAANAAAAIIVDGGGNNAVDHANDNNNNGDSFLMDPLLNLMIILLASICYLLLQKYYDLEEELHELRGYVEDDVAGNNGGQY